MKLGFADIKINEFLIPAQSARAIILFLFPFLASLPMVLSRKLFFLCPQQEFFDEMNEEEKIANV